MKKILVVEDEPGIQTFIKKCLMDSGYSVETADDGVEAIANRSTALWLKNKQHTSFSEVHCFFLYESH